MTTVTINDLIEYLLKRQFGSLAPPPVPALSGHSTRSDLHVFAEDRQQQIAATRAEYQAMNPDEVRERAKLAHEEDAQAAQRKAEQEEQALLYHQPHANADLAYWSKMATWTLEEAVALSFGKDPGKVNWETVTGSGESFIPVALARSPFRKEYARRRSLVGRAIAANELPMIKYDDRDGWHSTTKPEQFLAWALETFDEMPAELVEKVKARGKRVTDMQTLTAERDELKARIAELETQLQDGDSSPTREFDPNASDYPEHLHIAYQAWVAVASDVNPTEQPKARLMTWLNTNYPALSKEAVSRIATVCNWNRTGGRG